MTTTFSDLCDYLCEPLKHAHYVSKKRRLSMKLQLEQRRFLVQRDDAATGHADAIRGED